MRYYYRYTAQLAPRTFGDWDFTTGLRDAKAPLLVVHGARDSAALALQRDWAAAVPHGRLLAVPEAGKGAVADPSDVVLPAVATFLGGTWPEGVEGRERPARADRSEETGGDRSEGLKGAETTGRSRG